MKRQSLLALLLAIGSPAQYLLLAADTPSPDPANSPAAAGYSVVARAAHSRSWARVTFETNRLGIFARTNTVVELETFMHRPTPQGWVECSEQIRLLPEGGAVADEGPWPATFPADLYDSAISLTTPQGTLLARPLGLAYFDGERSLLVAELKPGSIGQLLPSGNQILWTNICTDARVDLIATYRKSGYQSDLVIREHLPDPRDWGFSDLSRVRVQWLTEFFNPPTPQVRSEILPNGLQDDFVDFVELKMVRGKCWTLGDDPATAARHVVAKRWAVLDAGRTFVVEEIPWLELAPHLEGLPLHTAGLFEGGLDRQMAASSGGWPALPAFRPVQRSTEPLSIASADYRESPGFIVDFDLIGSLTNFALQADTCYLATNTVNLYDAVIEGGTVIKLAPNPNAQLNFYGTLQCKTGPFRMAVVTSKDDNSIGSAIGTGQPTNYCGGGLALHSDGMALSRLRVAYADTAVSLDFGLTAHIWHSQFVKCNNALSTLATGSFHLHNVLGYQLGMLLGGNISNGGDIYAEHLTLDECGQLSRYSSSVVNLTNSLVVAVTNIEALDITNSTAVLSDGTGVFQTVGGAAHYLADYSPYRNAGTTNINPTLRDDLTNKTTFPPLVYYSQILSNNQVLFQRVQRETGPNPDIGYAYDALDYALGHVWLQNGTLTVAPGTAIATFLTTAQYYGLALASGARLVCQGSPIDLNRIVRYSMVQEQANTNWNPVGDSIISAFTGVSVTPEATFRFTDWSMAAQEALHFRGYSEPTTVHFTDCQFHGGEIFTEYPALNTTNCLFERTHVNLYCSGTPFAMSLRNNLFNGGKLELNQETSCDWSFKDNLFDHATIAQNGITVEHNHNGYTTGSDRLTPTNATDVVAGLSYESGPLGNYYQPTNSPFIDAGTDWATNVGLYHFTILTNQSVEAASIVDIGFHFAAVDTNGEPVDTDGGFAWDYLEDWNGDGSPDGDASDWTANHGSDDNKHLLEPGYLRCEYRVDPWGVDAIDPWTTNQKPRLFWIVSSPARGAKQLAYQIWVATSTNLLKNNQPDMWDSGKVYSDQTIQVEYNGKELQSGQRLWWQVRTWNMHTGVRRWSTNAFFQMGLLSTNDWNGVKWIWMNTNYTGVCPMYRKALLVPTNNIKRATAYASAKGAYELWINGQRIGKNILAPEWTDFRKRIQYQTFDVTTNLISAATDGSNHVVGAVVGEGWFAEDFQQAFDYGAPLGQFALRMDVEHTDTPEVTSIVTDSNWTFFADGPIRLASIWHGETYDATKEAAVANWTSPIYTNAATNFTGTVGPNATNVDYRQMVAQPTDPIQIMEYRHPVDMWNVTSPDGHVIRIFDMGQNMAGWCSLSLTNASNTNAEISLQHGEVLELDAQMRQIRGARVRFASLREALQTDTFRVGSSPQHRDLHPHFTYHGFRFVEVHAPADIQLGLDSVVGCVIRSAIPETTAFASSQRDVNQLMTNISWTLKGNLYGIETDCPQRDERYGWLGDSDAFSQTACFIMDMSTLYTRGIRDIRDEQAGGTPAQHFGLYQPQNPFNALGSADVGWSTGGLIKPWHLYRNYGDKRMLMEHYLSMRNWLQCLVTEFPNRYFEPGTDIWRIPVSDWLHYGTISFAAGSPGWPPENAKMSDGVHGTCFYAYSADLLAEMSNVLESEARARGNNELADQFASNVSAYSTLAGEVRNAFDSQFVTKVGDRITHIGAGVQGDYTYALWFNMVAESSRQSCFDLMIGAEGIGIRHYNDSYLDPTTDPKLPDTNHLSTGIQATGREMLELTRNGQTALAYTLLTDYRFPSWLYQVTAGGAAYTGPAGAYGATTCHERWDGWVARFPGGYHDGTVPSMTMNSFNHFWAGSVAEWVFKNVAGINPDQNAPGFQNIIIWPRLDAGISNAVASFNSIHGPITNSWYWTTNAVTTNFSLALGIPANTTAWVYLPSTNLAAITEGGNPATNAAGLLSFEVQITNRATVFRFGAGNYSFNAAGVAF